MDATKAGRSYESRSFRTAQNRLLVFNEPTAQRISTPLACEIGLVPSIVLLQMEFDIVTRGVEINGRLWVRASIDEINAAAPYVSRDTIKRTVRDLVKMNALDMENHNEVKTDRTYWYAISPKMNLKSIRVMPVEAIPDNPPEPESDNAEPTIQQGNLPQCKPAPCPNPIRNARASFKELEKSEEAHHDFLRNPSDIPPVIEKALRKVKAIGLIVGTKEKSQWAEFGAALVADCGNSFERAAAEIEKRFGGTAWKMPDPPRLSQIGSEWGRQEQRQAKSQRDEDNPNIIGTYAHTQRLFREQEQIQREVMAERQREAGG